MRPAAPFERTGTPRLARRRVGDRTEWWTEAAGRPPAVYGERWTARDGRAWRAVDPTRSKLGAALVKGWASVLPHEGEQWLYLGAASGTTASHVADLVGPNGSVFAVEKSPRPFARLLEVADRWTNLVPILDDAREPERYVDLVPVVDGVYADIAQPDQVGVVLRNAELFLGVRLGALLIALKTPSLGRDRDAAGHLREAERRLESGFRLDEAVRLEPFHRGHYLLGGRRTAAPAAGAARAGAVRGSTTPRRGPRPERRRS